MQTNVDITIYNKSYDPEKRTDVWNRTVILGVHQYTNSKAVQVNGVERRQDEGSFRVPSSCPQYCNYATELDYLSMRNPKQYWTLKPEDLIVIGVYDLEITGISTLVNAHIRPWKITSVSDNRRGTTPHLRARCE